MRRSIRLLTAVSGLALLLAATGVAAQDAAPLAIGDSIKGKLTAEDPVGTQGGGEEKAYDAYTFTAPANQRLEVLLESDDFDAFLELYTGDDLVSEDDDGGPGTAARMMVNPEVETVYVARARSLDGGLGDYTLSLTSRPPAAEPSRGVIAVGQTVEGELSDDDGEDDDNGARYDSWILSAQAGQRVALTLASDDFDALMIVGRTVDGVFEELSRNDDGLPAGSDEDETHLDSYLVFSPPEAGDYEIRATAFASEERGAYTLTAAEGPPPPETHPLVIDEAIEGELAATDAVDVEGYRHDAYRIRLEAGQRVAIEMRSDDFDAYLELGRDDGAGFEVLNQDDDGLGQDTDSRLVFTSEKTGDYIVHARSFSATGEGDYTLKAEIIPPDPEPTPIASGADVEGEITDRDPEDDGGRHFDAYRLSGVEGRRVRIEMRSGDFDTFLQIGSADGEFEALAEDDDGLREGTDSRLNFTFPETGDYIIRALPLGNGADGLYALTVVDRGLEPTPGSILVGSTARGSLGEGDAMAEDGSNYDAYRINLAEGEKLRIIMASNDFDSFVSIGREKEDGEFEMVASDDDSFADNHAVIEPEIDEAGVYVIRANSYAPNATGDYVLIVERK